MPGFETQSQPVTLAILGAPMLKFSLTMAGVATNVSVIEEIAPLNQDASSPPVTVEESDILHTPGADRASSIAFITDYVPGAFLLHDHLHMRGGHQVSWLVDGVPVPNTNLSSNVGRQLDPKDIQNVEVSRGGYSAKYGDRTYGMVNIVPRSGFEFENRQFDLTTGYGSFNQTNDQLSFGGHSPRFAYYGSLSGNRTDLGLEPPATEIIHNNGNGTSGFTSLNYNITSGDELRLAASARRDHYWIPNTPADQALGIRDVDKEKDGFANFSWIHTFNPHALLTTSPFYHYNNASYVGGACRSSCNERQPDLALRGRAGCPRLRQGSAESQYRYLLLQPAGFADIRPDQPRAFGSRKIQAWRQSVERFCRRAI